MRNSFGLQTQYTLHGKYNQTHHRKPVAASHYYPFKVHGLITCESKVQAVFFPKGSSEFGLSQYLGACDISRRSQNFCSLFPEETRQRQNRCRDSTRLLAIPLASSLLIFMASPQNQEHTRAKSLQPRRLFLTRYGGQFTFST